MKKKESQMWRHTPVMPAVKRLRWKCYKPKENLDYIARPCLNSPSLTYVYIYVF